MLEKLTDSIVELDEREEALLNPVAPEVRAKRVLELTEQIESLKAELDIEKLALANHFDNVGTYAVGDYSVNVQLRETWTKEGKEECAAKYPLAEFPHFYKQPELNVIVINKVTPSIIDSHWKKMGDPVVRVSLIEPTSKAVA